MAGCTTVSRVTSLYILLILTRESQIWSFALHQNNSILCPNSYAVFFFIWRPETKSAHAMARIRRFMMALMWNRNKRLRIQLPGCMLFIMLIIKIYSTDDTFLVFVSLLRFCASPCGVLECVENIVVLLKTLLYYYVTYEQVGLTILRDYCYYPYHYYHHHY